MPVSNSTPNLQANSAERALKFLDDFATHNTTQYLKIRGVLARIYGLEQKDDGAMLHMISSLWLLPSQIEDDIASIPGLDTNAFAAPIGQLRNSFTHLSLHSSASDFEQSYDKGLLNSLKIIAAMLNKDTPQYSITEDERSNLRKQVSKLIVDVREAELEDEFKDFIIHKLNSIHYALAHYEIIGAEELVQRVDQLFGGIIRKSPSILQSSSKTTIAKKALRLGAAVLIALEVLNSTLELGMNAQQILTPDTQQNAKDAEGLEKATSPRRIAESSKT